MANFFITLVFSELLTVTMSYFYNTYKMSWNAYYQVENSMPQSFHQCAVDLPSKKSQLVLYNQYVQEYHISTGTIFPLYPVIANPPIVFDHQIDLTFENKHHPLCTPYYEGITFSLSVYWDAIISFNAESCNVLDPSYHRKGVSLLSMVCDFFGSVEEMVQYFFPQGHEIYPYCVNLTIGCPQLCYNTTRAVQGTYVIYRGKKALDKPISRYCEQETDYMFEADNINHPLGEIPGKVVHPYPFVNLEQAMEYRESPIHCFTHEENFVLVMSANGASGYPLYQDFPVQTVSFAPMQNTSCNYAVVHDTFPLEDDLEMNEYEAPKADIIQHFMLEDEQQQWKDDVDENVPAEERDKDNDRKDLGIMQLADMQATELQKCLQTAVLDSSVDCYENKDLEKISNEEEDMARTLVLKSLKMIQEDETQGVEGNDDALSVEEIKRVAECDDYVPKSVTFPSEQDQEREEDGNSATDERGEDGKPTATEEKSRKEDDGKPAVTEESEKAVQNNSEMASVAPKPTVPNMLPLWARETFTLVTNEEEVSKINSGKKNKTLLEPLDVKQIRKELEHTTKNLYRAPGKRPAPVHTKKEMAVYKKMQRNSVAQQIVSNIMLLPSRKQHIIFCTGTNKTSS